jgi:hypothetical protein
MKTQNKKQEKFMATLMAVLLIASITYGHDLTPPPYRGSPLSVSAEWQYLPGTTFLNLTNWSSVDDSDPSTYLYPNFTPTAQVIPNAGIYQLQIPNFVDNMAVKYMRVQLTWDNTLQPPVNIFSQALDGTNSIFASIVYTSTPIVLSNGVYQYYDFVFKPNPDFERLHVEMPANALLTQIVVDTVSTPEPATIMMLGLGALTMLRRKNILT